MRLKLGASVLAAARAVDTRFVTDGLRRFQQVHQTYFDAQGKVGRTQTALDAARTCLRALDAERDDAVELLARALASDGHGRMNPFAVFGAPSPSAIGRLAYADRADTIRRLVAAVLRSKEVSTHSLHAAQSALDATQVVEQALDSILHHDIRNACTTRDAIGRRWDSALAAFRRKARAAADDGAPQLYGTLFPPVRRSVRKRQVPAEKVSTTGTPQSA